MKSILFSSVFNLLIIFTCQFVIYLDRSRWNIVILNMELEYFISLYWRLSLSFSLYWQSWISLISVQPFHFDPFPLEIVLTVFRWMLSTVTSCAELTFGKMNCLCVCVVRAKKPMECLIKPLLLYQSKYKVNIDLSGPEKGNGWKPVQSCRMRRTTSCLDINNGDSGK